MLNGVKVVVSSVKLQKVLSESNEICNVDKVRQKIMKWLT